MCLNQVVEGEASAASKIETITIVLMSVLLLLIVAITAIIVWKSTKRTETGRVFRNRLYGLYYKDDVRIDEGVVEMRERNVEYGADTDNDEDDKATSTAVTERNPNYKTVTVTDYIVDDDGYARLPPK